MRGLGLKGQGQLRRGGSPGPHRESVYRPGAPPSPEQTGPSAFLPLLSTCRTRDVLAECGHPSVLSGVGGSPGGEDLSLMGVAECRRRSTALRQVSR